MNKAAEEKPSINIGPLLRARRKELNLTLADVAERVGVAKGFLSDVERDKSSPSVASLVQICNVLNLPIGDLFATGNSSVVRRADRTPIKFGGHEIKDFLLSPGQGARMQAILSFMEPGGGGGDTLYSLDCEEEFVFVLSGTIKVKLENEEIILREGDAMTFSPRQMHTFQNASQDEPANVMFIVHPPPVK